MTRGPHVVALGEGPAILLVHGSFAWGEQAFADQRPLAARFRLLVLDRRGFGRSPDADRVDFDVDAADVARVLERQDAHLVGHSYGGLVCLLAAAQLPARVRSLTVIEPPAFALARGDPAVERLVGAAERHRREGQELPPAEYYAGFLRAWGVPVGVPPRLKPEAERAFRSSMRERPPWEAEVDLEPIRRAGVPALVVRGGWQEASPAARELAGAAFAAVCAVLERELDARVECLPDAAHRPQTLGGPFNRILAQHVDAAERSRGLRFAP